MALHWNSASELRCITCRMGSHSVTCHPTQVNTPPLTPASKLLLECTAGFIPWMQRMYNMLVMAHIQASKPCDGVCI